MKRLLTLFAAMCCMMVAGAANGIQIEYETGKYMYFILDQTNLTATVTWGGETKSKGTSDYTGEITVPQTVTYEGKKYDVTSVGDYAFYACKNLTSVVLPEGVTSIGTDGFYACYALKSISLPNSLESIGTTAFIQNYALTNITIPSGVTSIGDDAFLGSTNLIAVEFKGENPPTTTMDTDSYPFRINTTINGYIYFIVPEGKIEAYTAALPNAAGVVTSFATLKTKVLTDIPDAIANLPLTSDELATLESWKEAFESATDLSTLSCNKGAFLPIIAWAKYRQEYISAIDDAIANGQFNEEELAALDEIKRNIAAADARQLIDREMEKALSIYLQNAKRIAKDELNDYANNYFANVSAPDISSYLTAIDNAGDTENVTKIFNEAKSFIDSAYSGYKFAIIGEKKWALTLKEYNPVSDLTGLYEPADGSQSVEFPDAAEYKSNYMIFAPKTEFHRDLSAAEVKWQCWYEPFDVYVNTDNFDAAVIYGIFPDNDGNPVVAFKKLNNGDWMLANHVYVIRAKEGKGDLTIPFADIAAIIGKSIETTLSLNTAYEEFCVTGNYTDDCPKNDKGENIPYYTLDKNGVLSLRNAGDKLKPQRFYITIRELGSKGYYGTDHQLSAKDHIDFTVLGDDATSIEEINDNKLRVNGQQSTVYDLMGRKVTSLQSGQIYIMNGRKYIAK